VAAVTVEVPLLPQVMAVGFAAGVAAHATADGTPVPGEAIDEIAVKE
jgi:hypothetical protein